MRIALACDHAGFEQMTQLQAFLQSQAHVCKNFGPSSFKKDDDYPDFITPAAKAVANGDFEAGIIIGGSGQGEAIAANRIKGVRCAVFYGPAVAKNVIDAEGRTSHDPYSIVKLSRQHNNSNVLSFGARFVGIEEMKNVSKLWLDTPFSGDERHQRRNHKLDSGD